MTYVGTFHDLHEHYRGPVYGEVFLLDENLLLVHDFTNDVHKSNFNIPGLENGHFIVGFESFSISLDLNTPKDALWNKTTRQKLFVEANKKGSYIKYPNYATEDEPMPLFNGEQSGQPVNSEVRNDIILE